MKVLDKILRRHPAEEAEEATAAEAGCVHAVLAPKWERVADMGNEENVSSFLCETCNESFTPEEGHRLQETLAERVHLG